MENLIGEYWVVEIPKGAIKFFIALHDGLHFIWELPNGKREIMELPPGNWTLIGISDEITELECQDIVETFSLDRRTGHKDYGSKYISYPFSTATQSFQSLLTSKGLKGRYAILKTNK